MKSIESLFYLISKKSLRISRKEYYTCVRKLADVRLHHYTFFLTFPIYCRKSTIASKSQRKITSSTQLNKEVKEGNDVNVTIQRLT